MRAIICLLAALGVSVHADLELTYFAAKGRAEPLRLMLHFANIPFTDTRIQWSQWLSIKNDTTRFPYGVMPVLRINNTVIAETAVVTRYIARIVNLNHYADLMDSARLDEIYTLGIEFVDMIHRYLTISLRDGKQATAANYTTTFLPTAQRFIPLIDGKLQGSQSGLFSPLGLSYVDFFWAGLIDWINDVHPEIVQQFPRSVALKNEVYSLPQLQSYLATRDSLNAPTANTGLNIG
ncbi:unnamed protein product [Bursaphelenchus xylophilus]|uniref:glutathione transferase n=1 Tax=Bursaphelenchus xylophilus TaxID=6326 RepID=A0A7I8WM27_BURXY|nr:unnamed protein product [Bursaphelenchus xylophilus]CAG9104695.1 unnamed protein product [Bursaphelenchus xylophilus]